MLGRTLLFAAGIFGVVALAVPSAEKAAQQANEALPSSASGTQAAPDPAAAGADWYAGDLTLQRQFDGHFYADAYVQGVGIHMLVDTGASVIALTAADANAIGLSWNDSDIRPIGQGASGTVYGVQTRLREVEIGGITRRNVDAVIIPQGLSISLLGQSYLAQVGSVEIADDQMILSAG